MAIRKKYVSIKRREIRRASKAGSRRTEEKERGRRRKTWEEERTRRETRIDRRSAEKNPSPPPFFPLSRSYATKLVPALGGKRRPMVRRRRSPFGMPFGEAPTTLLGTRAWRRGESICIHRERCALTSLSPALSHVQSDTSGNYTRSRLAETSSRFLVLDFSSSLWRVINISLVRESRT